MINYLFICLFNNYNKIHNVTLNFLAVCFNIIIPPKPYSATQHIQRRPLNPFQWKSKTELKNSILESKMFNYIQTFSFRLRAVVMSIGSPLCRFCFPRIRVRDRKLRLEVSACGDQSLPNTYRHYTRAIRLFWPGGNLKLNTF